MKLEKSCSRVQVLTLALLASLVWAGLAQAAPIYRGKFTLPFPVRWGQAVIPAGDYQFRFEDVGTRAFAVIQDAKSGKDLAMLSATAVGAAQGGSALVIAYEGNLRVVRSLRLAELGQAFSYEPAPIHGTKGIEEAHTTSALPITAMK